MDVIRSLESAGRAGRYWESTEGGQGKRSAPAWFNWSPIARETATLRDALAPYLAASGVPEHRKQKLNEALRLLLPSLTRFPLGRKCPASEICKAAALVPAARIHDLPALVKAAAISPTAGESYARHIRGLMRWAAAECVVPVMLPEQRPANAWDAYRDRLFPLPEQGGASSATRNDRRLWEVYREGAVSLHGAGIMEQDPDSLTPQDAHAVTRHLKCVMGRVSSAAHVASFLLRLRDEHQAGPYRELEPNPFLTRSASGARTPRHMLVMDPNDPNARADNWDALRRALRREGFPEDWQDFLSNYEAYSTLDVGEIDARSDEFPARPPKQQLGAGALLRRVQTIRIWLGTAVAVVGMERETLTPHVAFGTHYRLIWLAVRKEWAARAKFAQDRRDAGLPPEDLISDEASKGLEHYVVVAGMMAQALLRRLQLVRQRGRGTDLEQVGKSRTWRVDVGAVRGAVGDDIERALFEAFEDSRMQAQMLHAAREQKNGNTGDSNTAKSLDRIIEDMPATKWMAMYHRLQEQVQRLLRTERRALQTQAGVKLVMHTLILGILLSTACRESELYHLRFDIQFFRRRREIVWRAIDRKNKKKHYGVLRPGIVPDWLLDLWCDECRPWLMTGQHVAAGRPAVAPHEFLFVNLDGRAIGCVEEDRRGKGRDKRRFNSRKGAASRLFVDTLGAAAAALGYVLLEGYGEFGEHAIRGAVGHAVYQDPNLGPQAAANLLGDTLKTIEKSYSRLDARGVDMTLLAAFADLRRSVADAGTDPRRDARIQDARIQDAKPSAAPKAIESDGALAFYAEWQALHAQKATMPEPLFAVALRGLTAKYA
jgi:integrase